MQLNKKQEKQKKENSALMPTFLRFFLKYRWITVKGIVCETSRTVLVS